MIKFNDDVVSFLDDLIDLSVSRKASDIHIELDTEATYVRLRVDGDLVRIVSLPLNFHQEIITRVKILSDLDIAERRLPQDGRISWKNQVDLRVSIIPTINGEKAVIRILNNEKNSLSLEDLNLSQDVKDRLVKTISLSSGALISTGPTGCGKTSTLYALLKILNKAETNIISVEDPVEYRINGISQIQVNSSINMTFARGLRSILRSDPDIIMVGEIRDGETAEIAVRAAITGHLVLTTLHTVDSYSAIMRLMDMGVEPYLLASSITGIQSQRLVKTLCPYCSRDYKPDLRQASLIKSLGGSLDARFKKPVGCEKCIRGYKGRQAVSEMFLMDEDFISLVKSRADLASFRKLGREKGLKSLVEDGLLFAGQGLINLDDLINLSLNVGEV